MNTEHELFGELHEQEENGLFGNEHRRKYEAQEEALCLSAVSCLICPSCGNSDKYVKYYGEDKICNGCGYDLGQICS
jgi:uncharacterized protein (DUF983 family)